ncbi:MAG: M20/M25/M40 family metallo-hydrolase [Planctomycetes bacterium]|nr:M20/M25/M40 family metallo-hydrolase [Planctomycetota bacterium]
MTPTPPPARAWPRLAVAFVAYGLAVLAAPRLSAPPAPLALDADATRPSAARARAVLTRLLGDEAPHPVGTSAHAAVVERLTAEIRALGIEPRVEESLAAGHNGVVTRVRNVVARVPGRNGSGRAVALAAHHDSVGAGPGAADDGAGVAAALEVVRALQAGTPLEHDLVLLVTDGEEVDLSGAWAFVRGSPDARDVRAVVNLEARGTTGRAHLFQTGPGVGDAIARFGALAPNPATSSLSAFVYDVLPNDTDLSVFLAAGWTGLNLAFIGDVRRYHTPRDDLAHLDDRSLQHLADGALSAVRALDGLDLATPHAARGERVWHDVLGVGVVSWPRGWSAALACAALLALGCAAFRWRTRPREVAAGALALCAALAGSALLATGLALLAARGHDAPDPWFAAPDAWAALGRGTGLLGAVLAAALPFARRARAAALFTGTWLAVAALGLVVALLAPGACPPLVAPAVSAGIAALALGRAPGPLRIASATIVAFAAGAALWLPFLTGIEEALGYTAGAVPGALAGLAAGALLPLLAPPRRAALFAAGALALGAAGLAALAPDRSPSAPVWTNVVHVQSADAQQLVVQTFGRRAPPELGAGPIETGRPEGWSGLVPRGFVLGAARHAEPPPEADIEVLAERPTGRHLRLRLRSARGAPVLALELPEGVRALAVRSGSLELDGDPPRGTRILFAGIGPEGLQVELLEERPGPHVLRAADLAPGLPAAIAYPLVPDPAQVPRGRGHGSLVVTTLAF